MGQIRIDYKPTPKQRMFHETTAEEVLYGGAAGGGKTKATVMDALMRVIKHKGGQAYIFRKTFPELERTVIQEALRSYPMELYEYNSSKHEMYILDGKGRGKAHRTGSMIHFCHCQNDGDERQYQGAEIHFLYFDELTHFPESQYDYICSRKRVTNDLGIVPIVRATSNPGGIGHGWVKARFVDMGDYGRIHTQKLYSATLNKTKLTTIQYIPALATDNPYITQDYVFELEKKPEALRNALLYGHWDAFEGQVFTEFKNDKTHYDDHKWSHVITPFEIPDWWTHYMSFDWGVSKPFSCGWWAVSPDGTAYRYREWYGWNGTPDTGLKLTARQVVEGILAIEKEETEKCVYMNRVADPAIFLNSSGDGSVASLMEPFNVVRNNGKGIFFDKGNNDRLNGLAQVHERMRFDEDGYAKLYVFDTCKQFIRTIPNLPYSIRDVEDVDTKAEDHIYDDTRYFCMACPVPRRDAPRRQKKRTPFDPFEWDRKG